MEPNSAALVVSVDAGLGQYGRQTNRRRRRTGARSGELHTPGPYHPIGQYLEQAIAILDGEHKVDLLFTDLGLHEDLQAGLKAAQELPIC